MACSYQIFIYLFLIERQFLYNIVLVSAIHQYESAIGVHMSPPSWTSFPPLYVVTELKLIVK